ncbi:MAG: hypothetical protein GEU71_06765 [Actinobacteria bacterium]|nr:hypothetical protein [Actinomycetota bacterium]
MPLHPFVLHRPDSAEEVIELRSALGEDAALYAGGTELLSAMKMGAISYEHLIDVKRVPGLREIFDQDGSVHIGATATHHEIENHPVVVDRLPSLAKLTHSVANVRVRVAGTIAGNLAFGEPHADPPALLMALGGTVVVQGAKGRRSMDIAEFCVGAYETGLREDELIVEVDVPIPPPGSVATYMKFQVLERPSVGVACLGEIHDGRFTSPPRLVIGAVDEVPRLVDAAAIDGADIQDEAGMGAVCDAASRAVDPTDDLSGSADYKRHLVGVLARRVLRKLAGEP